MGWPGVRSYELRLRQIDVSLWVQLVAAHALDGPEP